MNEDRSLFTFILSLAVHGLFAWILITGISPFQEKNEVDIMEFDVVEIENPKYIINEQPEPKREKTLEERLKEEAKFLSNLTRRVEEQIRARQGLKTRDGISSPIQRPQDGAPEASGPSAPTPKFTYDPGSNAEINPPPTLRKMAIGTAEFAERVSGIKQGFFNSLNTDQLTYFTFYNRVNEQIGYRWVSLVKDYLYNLPVDQLRRVSDSNKRTVVEVLLDQQGNYFSSLIHNSSGIQALDEATYKAFRLATPFLNPPQGLVSEEDGLIHLYYEFNVIFDPLPMAGPADF